MTQAEQVMLAKERYQQAGIAIRYTGEVWEISFPSGTVRKSTDDMISRSLELRPISRMKFDRFGAGRSVG